MPFWSGEKIKEVGEQHKNFISNFDAKNIDCSAYTLKMGNEYFVTANSSDPHRGHNQRHVLDAYASFVIPPGQFAFLLTKETIDVPADVMAFISMKATYKFQGLINVSGFHVDPGYRGHLVFSVYNAGPAPVRLREGLPLFLIWFADLDRVSNKVRAANTEKVLSNDLLKGMSGEILSLQSVSEDLEKIRLETRVQTVIMGAVGAIFLAVVVGIAIYVIEHGIDSVTGRTPPQPSINILSK
jgi:dCTP deaminase